mmetsp:Transcript_5083/g.7162  ORF Transcript_5083/g.7162 Transcript_5083/m.7162 type:complete len:344 (-) Transcript_5083:17-1048(-)
MQLLIFVTAMLVHNSWSFTPQVSIKKHPATSTGTTLELESSSNNPEPLFLPTIEDFKLESYGNDVELWLDLRNTSMPPQAALLHLTNDLWDEYIPPSNKSFIVDKVIVNKKYIQNFSQLISDIREEFEDEISLVVVEDEDGIPMSGQDGNGSGSALYSGKKSLFEIDDLEVMIPMGKCIKIAKDRDGVVNSNVNPMPILEIVSSGKWVLLDSEENVDKESICSLVEFIVNGVDTFGKISLGGSDESSLPSSDLSNPNGGIGIACNDDGNVVEMAALLRSLSGNKIETTDSGILLQSSSDNSGTDQDGEDEELSSKAGVGYAIVMPFDAMLWKTASFLFGADEE